MGALGAGAAAAALGATPPGWFIGGAALLGAAAAAAASKLFWPPPPGDGTEGTSQPQVIPVPETPGQPGKVPGASYKIQPRLSYKNGTSNTLTTEYFHTGPISRTVELLGGTNFAGDPIKRWRLWNGSGAHFYQITNQTGANQQITNVVAVVQRTDGTTLANDIAQGTEPYIPPVQATNVTNNLNISTGDTIINAAAPALPPGSTPVVPPPVAPPQPATPTAATATATPSAAPSPNPQPAPSPNPQPAPPSPTPAPSPNPQPAPPLTANPSAPTTGAGTPTPQAPTTGPRPSPGSASTAGGGTTTATLIAGVSPAIAGLITATNNALKPQPQTPTGTPVVVPGTDNATGPNNQPVNQTQPAVIPGTTTTPGTSPTPGQNTVGNQITQSNQQQQNNQQQLIDQITNPTGQGTTTTTTTTTTINQQLLDLQKKSDADAASTLAILGTLATMAALNQSTSTITTAIQNQPSPCAYPAYHPTNQAERAAISSKVDGVNTVLGTVTNVQIAEARTGITSIIEKIGSPIAGGAATLFEGIAKVQEWGDKFSRSLRLDRVYNALAVMLQIHNAAILSRNLGESLGFLIDASLQALKLKDEKDEEFNLTEIIGDSIENFIKSIIGADIYNGLSRQWKLISAIYTAAINVYEMSLSAFGGLAEGISVIGEYTGKVGNALKRSGAVMESSYQWMEDNFKIKMTRAGYLGRVAEGLEEAEDVVSNVTEFPESINEVHETIEQASDEIKDARQAAATLLQEKIDTQAENKEDSLSPNIEDSDAFKPPI